MNEGREGMLKGILKKVLSLGRASVFTVGLSMTLALTVGVASSAGAHTGSAGLFHLGHGNPVRALSSLYGSVANTVLSISNTSTASNAGGVSVATKSAVAAAVTANNTGGGPALRLLVASGKAPMVVSAGAAKVANLDADKVDGQDSTEFAAGTDGKANDADKLDGLDSDDFAQPNKRTALVSPVGTAMQNGTALKDALAGITDASATNPYLLKIEPGVYDLGSSGSLAMKEHIDLEGSGELTTIITSGVSDVGSCSSGTVAGADDAELRFLTVRNTGTGGCNIAIRNESASLRLTHVTVESTGAGEDGNWGVYNFNFASLTMSDATVTASGPTLNNTGVYNSNSSVIIKQSRISGNEAVKHTGQGTSKVALSQLVGLTKGAQCFNNYDENLQAANCD